MEGILSTGELLVSVHCSRPLSFLSTELRSVYVRIQQQVSSSTLKLIIKGFQACNTTFAMNYVISLSFHLAGKYDYQYVERQREGEEDEDGFSSRSGQRTMNKDIIKEEVVIAQGTL